MIDQELVDKIVANVVPEEYWPIKGLEGKEPAKITGIKVEPDHERFVGFIKKFHSSQEVESGRIISLCVNWGTLMRRAKRPHWNRFLYSNCIFIDGNADVGALELEFIILREVGFADWNCRLETLAHTWVDDKVDHYADYYAAQRLSMVYGPAQAQLMFDMFAVPVKERISKT